MTQQRSARPSGPPPGVDLFEWIKADLLAHEAKKKAEDRKKLRQAKKQKKGG